MTNDTNTEDTGKRFTWWWRIILAGLLVLAIVLGVVILNADTLAHKGLNHLIKRTFVEGGTLKAVDLSLAEGHCRLSDLTINPPPGFGPQPLLAFEALVVDIAPLSLLGQVKTIEKLHLESLSLTLVRDKGQNFSVAKVLQPAKPDSAPEAEDAPPASIPAIQIDSLRLDKLTVKLIDRAQAKEWTAGLALDLKIEDIRLRDLLAGDILIGAIELVLSRIQVDQPPGFEGEPLYALDRLAVSTGKVDLTAETMAIKKIHIDKSAATLIVNPDGTTSLQGLQNMLLGPAESAAEPSAGGDRPDAPPTRIPAIAIDSLKVNELAVKLRDRQQKKEWTAGLNLDLAVEKIQLKDLLKRDILIGAIELALNRIQVDQPPGFEGDPLFALDRLTVSSGKVDLAAATVAIKKIELEKPTAAMIVNSDGTSNFQALIKMLPQSDKSATVTDNGSDRPDSSSVSIPAITIESLKVAEMAVKLAEHGQDKAWSTVLHLDLGVEKVQLKDLPKRDILIDAIELAIKRIRVDQPPGFEGEPLFGLERLAVSTGKLDLAKSTMAIRKIEIDKPAATLIVNPDGTTSLQALQTMLLGQAEPDTAPKTGGDRPDTPPVPIPAIAIDSLKVNELAVQLRDRQQKKEWTAGLNLDLAVDKIQLKDLLKGDILIDAVELVLSRTHVDQPPGFEGDPFFALDRLAVSTGKLDLASATMAIKKIKLEKPTAAMIVKPDGTSNLQALKKILIGSAKPNRKDNRLSAPEANPSPPTKPFPAVRIDKIQAADGSIHLRHEALTKTALVFPLGNIQLEVDRLNLSPDKTSDRPASASLSFELGQPGDLPKAYFGTVAALGPLVQDVPSTNAQIRLIGLKLDTLGSLIPPATRTALGADGLDTGLALALNKGRISLNAMALTDRNIRYDTIHIQGPLNAPKVEIAPVMAGVFRVTDGVLSIGTQGLQTGVTLVEGGVNVAKEVGMDAIKIGKNLVSGLFKTGTGLVTLDQNRVKEGLAGSTRGTIDLSMDTVKGAGSTAGGGLDKSVSDLTGKAAMRAWDSGIPTRYGTAMQKAEKALASMPYPPVTD